MAAPEHVPIKPTEVVRSYSSPPRRDASWLADRPADLQARQPRGAKLGSQGPDQGYILKLARHFEDKLTLTTGEHERDALAGGCLIALKRASLFGRAPVVHDLRVGLTVWGFLGEAPRELVEIRKPLFAEISHPHHYTAQRIVADLVPDEVLLMSPEEVDAASARLALAAQPLTA